VLWGLNIDNILLEILAILIFYQLFFIELKKLHSWKKVVFSAPVIFF